MDYSICLIPIMRQIQKSFPPHLPFDEMGKNICHACFLVREPSFSYGENTVFQLRKHCFLKQKTAFPP